MYICHYNILIYIYIIMTYIIFIYIYISIFHCVWIPNCGKDHQGPHVSYFDRLHWLTQSGRLGPRSFGRCCCSPLSGCGSRMGFQWTWIKWSNCLWKSYSYSISVDNFEVWAVEHVFVFLFGTVFSVWVSILESANHLLVLVSLTILGFRRPKQRLFG